MLPILQIYKDSFHGLRREVWYLFLVSLINRAGTMVIPFLAIYMTGPMGFTYAQAGWVMTAFGIGSLAGSWLGGRLSDRYSFHAVMIGSLMGTGLMFIALQFVEGFWPFCACVLLIMIVADSFRPAVLVAINAYSKPRNRTRSVTLIRLAINLGFAFGPALGGWIIVTAGYSGLFWLDGITCILAGAIVIALLDPRKASSRETELTSDVSTAGSAYADKPYWYFLSVCFLTGFAFMQLFSTIPLYYREVHGLSEKVIGLMMGMNGMIIFLMEMPLVHGFERVPWRKFRVVQLSCFLMALSYILLNAGSQFGILVASMIVITIAEMLFFPFTNAIAMNRAPGNRTGQYLALYSMSYSAAHIIGPNIGMQLAQNFGFAVCWYAMAGVALLAVMMGTRVEKVMFGMTDEFKAGPGLLGDPAAGKP